MEITGKIISAVEPRGGISQRTGNTWKSQEFVIETIEQYPKRCVFNVFGEENLTKFNIQIGLLYTVKFDINAREWNGRWFNDVRAWDVSPYQEQGVGTVQRKAPQSIPQTEPIPFAAQSADSGNDDVPF